MLGVPPVTTRRTMTDDAAALLAAYDAQLRGAAEVQGSRSWDRSGPLWRAKFTHGGFVSYETLEGVADVDALIADTVDFFAGDPAMEEFEWKTRGHDWPPAGDDQASDDTVVCPAWGFLPGPCCGVAVREKGCWCDCH